MNVVVTFRFDDTMSSSSDDYEDIDNSARGRCHREDAEAIVPFGKDMIPSTQTMQNTHISLIFGSIANLQ